MQSPETAPVDSRERKPRRIWRIILIGCVALVLLFACWLLFERHRAKTALAKYEQQLLAKGEKLTFAELVSPFPEGRNAAPEFLRLCKLLPDVATLTFSAPAAIKLAAPGKAIVIAKQPGWSSGKLTFQWEEARDDLHENAETLVRLREVLRSPLLRSMINYRGHNTPLPHLAPSKAATQWLSASALYNLHIGDHKAAIDDIEAIVMVSQLSDEPFIISQLVRVAVVSIAVHDCWPILQTDSISEDQLGRLQKIVQSVDLITSMLQALRGERVMGRDIIHMLRAADTSFEDVADTLASRSEDGESSSVMEKVPYNEEIRDAIRTIVIAPMWRFVWSYDDERHMLEELQALIIATGEAKSQHSAFPAKAAAKAIKDRPGKSWSYWATDFFVGAIAGGPLRAFRFQAHNEMTITAIALKRYHLRHRKYPQKLDELVLEFLPQHPIDWMDGQKLRYRPEGDSFVLWSVGDNGVDDGGTPDQTEPYNFLNGPDIVWPQPASEGEVEQYYKSMKTKR